MINGKSLFFSFESTEASLYPRLCGVADSSFILCLRSSQERNDLHERILELKLENFVDYEDESKGSLLRYSVEKRCSASCANFSNTQSIVFPDGKKV